MPNVESLVIHLCAFVLLDSPVIRSRNVWDNVRIPLINPCRSASWKMSVSQTECYFSIAAAVPEYLSPCTPSPCGSNAICKEQNQVGSCTCLPEYIGNPYEGCRPECVINSDCSSTLACIRSKCQNPCPGTCGQNAECQVVNHLPSCTCIPGYTGDPFRYCNLVTQPGNYFRYNPIIELTLWNIFMCIQRSILFHSTSRSSRPM